MRNTILARRYAKALFSLGKQEEKTEEYSEKLSAIAALFDDEEAGLRDALTNPLYPLDVRQRVMTKIAENVQADTMLSGFLVLVVDKNRAAILPEIADELRTMTDKDRNISHGIVISAVALKKDMLAKVQTTLEKLTGTQVLLETKIDPSIIGGIVAKVGDLVLDGSIRTQLNGLKESIKGRD
ncbi:MAG: F0F1 ATP synthase subunit delta [Desulfobulbaceae bacterium]|nr:F0F1 ATP synthase subunit delta [Desulfobulbaceae bacterium]